MFSARMGLRCFYASTLRQVELLVAPFVQRTLLTLTLSEVPILR